LTIIANLSDHRVSTKLFLFEVSEIETQVDGAGPLDAILFGRTYTYNFTFSFESNSTDIHGGSVFAFGAGSEWVSYSQSPAGDYLVQIVPGDVGDYSVLLSFEQYGFKTSTFRLNFRVAKVPLTVIVNQGLVGYEGASTTLIVTILESDTGDPVSGALVSCRTLQGEVTLSLYEMTETATPGIYSTQIQMPDADGSYSIRVEVEASHHVLNSAYQHNLSPERTLVTFVQLTFSRYFYLFIGIGAVVVGYGYRRRSRKRRIRENLAAHQIKKRFDAVKNLLGVIVIHKESGLPIYSKILREGLDETVISAFITAITNFRGEFDIERSEEEEWALVPISDIVRVIATRSLYCAFITVARPSEEQRERMIRFAQTVSFIFDEQLKDVPIAVLDQHNRRQFESLFNDILDGALLKTYTLSEDKKYKPSSCADERIARRRGVEFLLDELAADIASCGLEEGRVYKAIMEAIERDLLVLIEKDEMVEMDIGFISGTSTEEGTP
jgi:hypothetical protein